MNDLNLLSWPGFLLIGLGVGRYITCVGQCRNSDASFVSSGMSVALNTSHKRHSLTGYCGGRRNEKARIRVASAHPAKNQRHAFENCPMFAGLLPSLDTVT